MFFFKFTMPNDICERIPSLPLPLPTSNTMRNMKTTYKSFIQDAAVVSGSNILEEKRREMSLVYQLCPSLSGFHVKQLCSINSTLTARHVAGSDTRVQRQRIKL